MSAYQPDQPIKQNPQSPAGLPGQPSPLPQHQQPGLQQQWVSPTGDALRGPILPPRPPATPRPRMNAATVFVYPKREIRVEWPGGRTTGGPRPWFQSADVYEVDLGRHRSSFSKALPAGNDGVLEFPSEIDIMWRVVDPALVVSSGLDNVEYALTPELLQLIQSTAAGVRAETPAMAQQRLNQQLGSSPEVSRIGAAWGLEISVFVRVSASPETAAAMQEVVRARIANELEQAKAQGLEQRAALYGKYIRSGDLGAVVMLMANDPASVERVMQQVWDRRAADRREIIDVLQSLVDSGMLGQHHLVRQRTEVLDWLNRVTRSAIGGPDGGLALDGSRSHRTIEPTTDDGADDGAAHWRDQGRDGRRERRPEPTVLRANRRQRNESANAEPWRRSDGTAPQETRRTGLDRTAATEPDGYEVEYSVHDDPSRAPAEQPDRLRRPAQRPKPDEESEGAQDHVAADRSPAANTSDYDEYDEADGGGGYGDSRYDDGPGTEDRVDRRVEHRGTFEVDYELPVRREPSRPSTSGFYTDEDMADL